MTTPGIVPITVFYKEVILINGTVYPVLPDGTRLTCPKGYVIPPIIGNWWQVNTGPGLRQPMVDVSFATLDTASGVISDTFLGYALTRTSDLSNDTIPLSSGINFFNGRSGFTLLGAKFEGFSMGCSSGQDIRFTARFSGSQIIPIGSYGSAFTSFDNGTYTPAMMVQSTSPVLRFSSVNFAGNLANVVWSFNMTYANNHTPNAPLNNSDWPAAMNAGLPTVSFNMTVQAATLKSTDINYNALYGQVPDNGAPTGSADTNIPGSIETIGFTIAGANTSVAFTLNNPIDNTPDEHDAGPPRLMRPHSYICRGANGQSVPPLSVA